ncbi:NAD(P)-dependent oxidoreductase [Hoeflea sp. YIM 152468]|uniref:NAD(P)-dependent oxidoreductase n=1 Tax=Hoeflea sp. YIM 152468 TaxID=3031759 RepID=UPI0023DCBFD0|nr:NAD(P)-dependent oxidoreductase [Hoeflea sp. YIM 152468]MDF1610179.1 NAD(P)-dependent oxidoreductase [Hoeflea sp. YIM 152468]
MIGFIGLGVMGAGMARNIAASGLKLAVTTSSPEKAETFRALGAEICATPAELATRCQKIVTCVPDAAALRSVFAGETGLAAHAWDNGLLIDCSTIAPFEAQEMAQQLAVVGGRIIDAPVSGGAKGAADGTLTIMCGGSQDDVAEAQPVLQAMGKHIHHVGPLGAGQALKACNQLMVAVNMMGVFEAVSMARAAGVDPRVMREVLSTGAARSGVLDAHALRYIEGTLDGGFRAELMRKDLGIANAVGAHFNISQPATDLAHQLMVATCNAGFAKHDSAALGLLYDRLNGRNEDTSQ